MVKNLVLAASGWRQMVNGRSTGGMMLPRPSISTRVACNGLETGSQLTVGPVGVPVQLRR